MKKLLFIYLAAPLLLPGQVCYNPPLTFGAGATPKAVTTGDLNEDGHADLVVANFGSNTLTLLKGLPGGNFQHDTTLPAGSAPHHVITADLNNDGHLDIAVANYNSGNVSVLLGNGQMHFNPAVNYTAGSNPTALAVADFTGDGFLDIGVAASGYDSVILLKGSGNGTFTRNKVLYAAGCYGLCAADLNGDNLPDMATCNCASASISVLLATGNGNFSPCVNYTLGSYYTYNPLTLLAADLNHDNLLDLVSADQGSVSVLLGTGGGNFAAPVSYFAGSASTTVVSDDFNRDGQPDIATANFGADVTILTGNGDGTLNAPIHLAAGNGPRGLINYDFNADGWPDLVTANNNSNDASVFLSCGSLNVTETTRPEILFYDAGSSVLSASAEMEARLYVFSVDGQQVFTQQVRRREEFQLGFLPAGAYIARLVNANGSVQKKFVKN